MKVFIVALSLISCSLLWAKSSVDIHVSLTPAGSFTGVSDKIKGKISKTENGFTSKRIELNIRSIRTGIDLRDEHLWEHLNYKTHSKATLTELTEGHVFNDSKAVDFVHQTYINPEVFTWPITHKIVSGIVVLFF